MTERRKKPLILYYTRTGRCEKLAEALSGLLGASDTERIEDEKDYAGYRGLATLSLKALLRKPSPIKTPHYAPAWYDEIWLVLPVWAGSIPPAVRSYLADSKLTHCNLIACSGWTSESGCKDELHKQYGIAVDHHARFCIDEVDDGTFAQKLRALCDPNAGPAQEPARITFDSPVRDTDHKEDAMATESKTRSAPAKRGADGQTCDAPSKSRRDCKGCGERKTRNCGGKQTSDKQ